MHWARRARSSVALGLLLVLIFALPAHAKSGSTTLMFAHPATMAMSVTESQFFIGNRCGSSPLLQGLDAYVMDLGEARTGRTLKVTTDSDLFGSPNLNVAYWTQGCKFTELHGNRRSPYYADVPSDARWAVISAMYGANVQLYWHFD